MARPWYITRLNRTGLPLLVMRLVLGGVFIYFGLLKLADPMEFLKQLHLYDILPERPQIILNSIALVLPWLELACGVALILGVWLRGSALILGGMLVVFMVALYSRAVSIVQAEGIPFCDVKFDCGCGTGVRIICNKLLENAGLLLLCLLILFSRRRLYCLSSTLSGERFLPLLATDHCPHCGQVMMHEKSSARTGKHIAVGGSDGASVPDST